MSSLLDVSDSITTDSALADSEGSDALVGYVSLVISCISFGFMFAPLRKYDCRDGFFVQWVECAVVFLVGVGIFFAREEPAFNWIATLGGVLYATGNIASVPIVKGIGIGLGMLIWGSIQITVGWCIARFGLFGTKPQEVTYDALNYAGVIVTIISGVMFVFVQQTETEQTAYELNDSYGSTSTAVGPDADIENVSVDGHFKVTELSNGTVENDYATVREIPEPSKSTALCCGADGMSMKNFSRTKILCILMSVGLGLFHGCMMTPIVYIQDNYPDASTNVLDYVFSFNTGVFTASTVYFFLYAIFTCNDPYIDSQLVVPSIFYGILWSIGMVGFQISNQKLSQTVSYPITARLPAIIGALTDVFIYRSIRGSKNLVFLAVSVLLGITGVVLVACSF